MKKIIVSTKLIPTGIIKKDKERVEFFKQMRKAGYRYLHFDFNRFETEELLDEKQIMKLFDEIFACDIEIINSHLPVDPFENIWNDYDVEYKRIIWRTLKQCLKYNNSLHIKDTVYHVPELKKLDIFKCQRFISYLPRLLEFSSKYDCSVSLENHYNAQVDNFILPYLFNRYSEETLSFTFDTGHYFLSCNEKIVANDFFGRLRLVHLNDNDKKTDLHDIPNIMKNSEVWERLFKKIKRNARDISPIFELSQDVIKRSGDYVESLKLTYNKLEKALAYYDGIDA